MKRHPLRSAIVASFAALPLLPALPWLGAACLGDIEVGPGDATTTTGGGIGGGGGAGGTTSDGGEEGCTTPADGYCSEESDCACTACANAAACTAGGCMANGFCDLAFEDSCVCSDCDWDQACMGMNGGGNCVDDGTCDFSTESCACADCSIETTCLDNQQLCVGGTPDGVCDPDNESCSCTDCLGAFACLCGTDTYCDFDEPCVCGDCWTDSYCSSSAYCTDDGVCDWLFEGCACLDCAGLTLCNGFP